MEYYNLGRFEFGRSVSCALGSVCPVLCVVVESSFYLGFLRRGRR